MKRPWFPFYVGDYTRDTARLTTEAHGAYLLLILDYWVNGPPPDDDDVLATITKLPAAIWRKRKSSIKPFFKVEGGRWIHGRVEKEIAAANEKHQKRVEAGKEGGKAKARGKQKASNATSDEDALLYQPQPQPPSNSNTEAKQGESDSRSKNFDVIGGSAKPIDETYEPSDRAIEYAYSLGMKKADLNSELSKFIASSMATRAVSFNPDMSFKVWCDRWLDYKRKHNPDFKPEPEVVPGPVEPYEVVVEHTLEAACWAQYNRAHGLRPLFFCKQLLPSGVVVIGARCKTLFPPGYDSVTGERQVPPDDKGEAA